MTKRFFISFFFGLTLSSPKKAHHEDLRRDLTFECCRVFPEKKGVLFPFEKRLNQLRRKKEGFFYVSLLKS